MIQFVKNTSGTFAIIAAIVLLPMVGLGGAVLTSGNAVLNKSDLQNAADLAAISASATQLENTIKGMSAEESSRKGGETMQRFYAYNIDKNPDEFEFTDEGTGRLSINDAGSTEIAFNAYNPDRINYNITATASGNYEATAGGESTFELVYMYDTSNSMYRTESRGVDSGKTGVERVLESAQSNYLALLGGLSREQKDNIRVAQGSYHSVTQFMTPVFTSNENRLIAEIERRYPGNRVVGDPRTSHPSYTRGKTNTHEAVSAAIEKLNNNNFNVPGKTNSQIIVLMTDGAPSLRTENDAYGNFDRFNFFDTSMTEKEIEVRRISELCKSFTDKPNNYIFTIYFETYRHNPTDKILEVQGMQNCQNAGFYEARTGAELDEVYGAIRRKLSDFTYNKVKIVK